MATFPGSERWRTLGGVAPTDLSEARLLAHWAAQVVMAAADGQLEHQPDDSQSSLSWVPDLGSLASQPLPSGHRAAIKISDLTLLWLGPDGGLRDAMPLDGRTLADACRWMADRIRPVARGKAVPEMVALRDYDMPESPVRQGSPFALGDKDALSEVARCYADASLILEAVVSGPAQASPVRCWPHHFDLDTQLTIAVATGTGDPATVAVGLSPGDGFYAEPYFYVNPSPTAEGAGLPELPAGAEWAKEWVGAILPGRALVEGGTPDTQAERAWSFLEAAIAAGRKLVGA